MDTRLTVNVVLKGFSQETRIITNWNKILEFYEQEKKPSNDKKKYFINAWPKLSPAHEAGGVYMLW